MKEKIKIVTAKELIDGMEEAYTNYSLTEIFAKIKNKSYNDLERIVLGEIVELHIKEDCIDIYKYRPDEDIDEDWKSEEDYLTTVYF